MRKTIKTVRVESRNGNIIDLKLMTWNSLLYNRKRATWMRHGKPVGVYFNRYGNVNVVSVNKRASIRRYVTVTGS